MLVSSGLEATLSFFWYRYQHMIAA